MQYFGYFISTNNDKEKTPGDYVTADELNERRLKAVSGTDELRAIKEYSNPGQMIVLGFIL